MLVLSREVDESLVIGCCLLTVLKISTDKVEIGVHAPTNIKIWRENKKHDMNKYDPSLDYDKLLKEAIRRTMKIYVLHKDENIYIGESAQITVVDIRDAQKVRLGISAAREMTVHRYEIYLAIQKEKDQLSKMPSINKNTEDIQVVPLMLLIDPGNATAEDLAELFCELSYCYQLRGGSGINFKPLETKVAITI